MLRLTAEETARAVGGRVIFGDEKQVITHISLDSRTAAKGDLFVPIIGERVDAHDFIGQVLKNGAAAVFTSRHQSREEAERAMDGQETGMSAKAEAAWIAVEDTRRALQALGSFLRSQNPIPLVGVTGSVGKTTTREMTAAALSAGFSVYKTPGNSNSQVGVPITLAEIPPEAQIGVIELGMSEPGEMTRIANIARVDCALITNIGVAHIEQLGSQENILREKLHIQDGMPADGPLLLNGDDPLLRTVHIPGGRSSSMAWGRTAHTGERSSEWKEARQPLQRSAGRGAFPSGFRLWEAIWCRMRWRLWLRRIITAWIWRQQPGSWADSQAIRADSRFCTSAALPSSMTATTQAPLL